MISMCFKSLGKSKRRISFMWSGLVCLWFQTLCQRIKKNIVTDTSFKLKKDNTFSGTSTQKKKYRYTFNPSFNMNSRCHMCKLLWGLFLMLFISYHYIHMIKTKCTDDYFQGTNSNLVKPNNILT